MRTGIADRAAGALLGMAAGDALGAGYEFGPALSAATDVELIGGGSFGWAPGEWTDDTQMAVPLLEAAELAAASGTALTDHLDYVARRWVDWAVTAADVGNQTRSVLATVRHSGDVSAAALSQASHALHALTGRTAGNGSLMRTAPVALTYLSDPAGLAEAARSVSALTHWDDDAGDACVLWRLAIRHAVQRRVRPLSGGLDALPRVGVRRGPRGSLRRNRVGRGDFRENGWVVHALQGAGRRSRPRRCRTAIRRCICDSPLRTPYAGEETPTRSRRSLGSCSVRAGAPQPCRWDGRPSCTVGRPSRATSSPTAGQRWWRHEPAPAAHKPRLSVERREGGAGVAEVEAAFRSFPRGQNAGSGRTRTSTRLTSSSASRTRASP